jgi:hypothetical protein
MGVPHLRGSCGRCYNAERRRFALEGREARYLSLSAKLGGLSRLVIFAGALLLVALSTAGGVALLYPAAFGQQAGMPVEDFLSKYGGMVFKFRYTISGFQRTLIEYFSTSRLKAQLVDAVRSAQRI